MVKNSNSKPIAHVYVDTYMSDDSLLLLFGDAGNALRHDEQVDIHVATSQYATKQEFSNMLKLASQTKLPDRIMRRTNIYTKRYGGYICERLSRNVLSQEYYDRGMGPNPEQQPNVRWILELDDNITLDKLTPILDAFPFFDASSGPFLLFISGKNAADIVNEYKRTSDMPRIRLID